MGDRVVPDGNLEELAKTIDSLKKNYAGNKDIPISFRIEQLKNLKRGIEETEAMCLKAYWEDLKGDESSVYQYNILTVLWEISGVIKNLHEWAQTRPVDTMTFIFPSKCYIKPQSRGVVCVIGSWNFPLCVTILPLISVIAAGNLALIKPSEFAPSCSAYIKHLCDNYLHMDYYRCFEGGVKTSMQ